MVLYKDNEKASNPLDFEGIRFLPEVLRFQKEVVTLQKKEKRFYGFVLRGELRLPTAFLLQNNRLTTPTKSAEDKKKPPGSDF